MKGNKSLFAKMTQRARRMAKATKAEKKDDTALIEHDFTKLIYRARQMARRVSRPKMRPVTASDSSNTVDVRHFGPVALSNVEDGSDISSDRSVRYQANCEFSTMLQVPYGISKMLQLPIRTDQALASVEDCPVFPGLICPRFAQTPAQILPPISIALLQSQIARISATAKQRVVPAMACPIHSDFVWLKPAKAHAWSAQQMSNALLQRETALAQHTSAPAALLIDPPIVWPRPAHAHAQGVHASSMLPPPVISLGHRSRASVDCTGMPQVTGHCSRSSAPSGRT